MINQNIARYRKKRSLTQEGLAERIGVSGQTVSKWENGVSSPDVSILPDLAVALGVDLNALFADKPDGERIPFERLSEVCCDRLLTLYFKALFDFYGWKGLEDEGAVREKVEKLKADFAVGIPKCGRSLNEGEEHGAAFVSDAFAIIDRDYGSPESASLFDLDRSGEILCALGRKDCRAVLREVYRKRIAEGEAAGVRSADQIADLTGLSAEAVREAAGELVRLRLLDGIEEIRQGECQRVYRPTHTDGFLYVLAILRLARLAGSEWDDANAILLYRDAVGLRHYEGPGL